MKRIAAPLVVCLLSIVCLSADRQTSAQENTTPVGPAAIAVIPGVHYEIGKDRYLVFGMPIRLTGARPSAVSGA
jgi:hypothetical protein